MNKPEQIKPLKKSISTDLLQVRHVTRYRYVRPVTFGVHRAMFRPHESNDLQLVGIEIATSPESAIHWMHDVFSNSTALFTFTEPSDCLEIACTFNVVRSSMSQPNFPISDFAKRYPFLYPNDQYTDLIPCIQPEYDHPKEEVRGWAQMFADQAGDDTWKLLSDINSHIRQNFEYRRREEPGVQTPRETIALGQGSCRDFAVLMMEAVRQLGLAARFVTGYLYDPSSDKGGDGLQGSGATHAWVQVYLPGAGWIEFDPTNGLIASGNLIRTGVARLPSQAAPLLGSYDGVPEDFLGMTVDVSVKALAPTLTS